VPGLRGKHELEVLAGLVPVALVEGHDTAQVADDDDVRPQRVHLGEIGARLIETLHADEGRRTAEQRAQVLGLQRQHLAEQRDGRLRALGAALHLRAQQHDIGLLRMRLQQLLRRGLGDGKIVVEQRELHQPGTGVPVSGVERDGVRKRLLGGRQVLKPDVRAPAQRQRAGTGIGGEHLDLEKLECIAELLLLQQ